LVGGKGDGLSRQSDREGKLAARAKRWIMAIRTDLKERKKTGRGEKRSVIRVKKPLKPRSPSSECAKECKTASRHKDKRDELHHLTR